MSILSYDPKLKEAAKKIKAILDEYQIVGFIQLMSETNAEYLNHLQDWTGILYKGDGEFRIRVKTKEIGKKEARRIIENATHVIRSLSRISALNFEFAEHLLNLFEENGIEIERDFSAPTHTKDH